ncbi:hypothetical protein [Salinicola sp. DM10]|uniref:phage tail fiber protein n=1 Tax=Salinicola sp. DM10 TaxID=2815721 RepID=UPI001A8D56A2|nr:hypothetical protein [Salinicola sp. DM10]MCE3025729.1 hypothetical protein [Salinicola sp. DM10]
MSSFSDYLEEGILGHTLRGAALAVPSTIYIALFTSDPTDSNTGNEVSDSGYLRQDAAKGGSIESGWTAPTASGDGTMSSNAKLVQFPPVADGQVTVSHYGIYDAQSGGNLLYHAPFTVAKTLQINDVLSIDVGGIQVVLR